jgi:SAM-dependent methyltransferase
LVWETLVSYYHDARALLKLRAGEFHALMHGVSLPLDRPALDIESAASPEQLSQIFSHIRDSWVELGTRRPHHSVLTEDEFLPGNLKSSSEHFWDSGDIEATIIAATLARCGFGAPAQKICVEYGCGVGRVTLPLAARFAEVYAYDISRTHLGLAEERATQLGAANIHFHWCGDGLPDRLISCDFFYSRLVLQHNPPPLIGRILQLALGSLNVGGIAIFGVPTYIEGYRFRSSEYLSTPRVTGSEMHCVPQSEIFALIAEQQCAVIEVHEEKEMTRARGLLSHVFVVERLPGDARSGPPGAG